VVEGLKYVQGLPTKIVPSSQQELIWELLKEGHHEHRTVCVVAFAKAIAEELKQRVPQGVFASTTYAMGNAAVRRTFPTLQFDKYRVEKMLVDLWGVQDNWEARRLKPVVLDAVQDLVKLCKQHLYDGQPEQLDLLCSRFGIVFDAENQLEETYELVPRVLNLCKDVERDNRLDYTDMVWLPIALDLSLYRYDLLLVDEAQDLTRAQQVLTTRAGDRLVYVGDPHQAIFGFAGADSKSMERMTELLTEAPRGCQTAPLTVTRRCAKAIVREANKYSPDFQAHPDNPEGLISYDKMATYRDKVREGDMVLCRVNAPLVGQCLKFIKMERRATIQGKKVGAMLKRIIDSLQKKSGLTTYTVANLETDLTKWLASEMAHEQDKDAPDEEYLIMLQDKVDCIMLLRKDCETVAEIKRNIEEMFTDDRNIPGIRLSSAHAAKGLEARRVFLLMPKGKGMPHPMAKTQEAIAQEYNLLYVAITRAMHELTYVT
jgi:superfamily I DNA/RNA helicase